MYRIFCESYTNYINSFEDNNSRLRNAKPLELIVNIDKFNYEKNQCSNMYKKLCDLIFYMTQNIKRFPKFKAFLWTLESRDIKPKEYKISKVEDLEEQIKLVNSILKLAYWY